MRHMNGRRSFRHALILTTAIAFGCAGEDPEPSTTVTDAVSVRATRVEMATLRRPVSAPGTFAPRDEVGLAFKVGGVVASVRADVGDEVAQGDTLATLDRTEIASLRARARSAEAKAMRDLERARALHADSVATLAHLQDAETAWEVAAADLEAASFNFDHAVVVAPERGVVLMRSAEPGEVVTGGTPVLRLGTRVRGAVIRLALPERDIVRVRRGAAAEAVFDVRGGWTVTGRVSELAASATPGTGTFAVEVSLDDAEGLVSGMIGRVSIEPTDSFHAVMLPVEAVVELDRDRAIAYTVSADGTVSRREVRVTLLDGSSFAVTEGLVAGELVVIEGAAWLESGALVRVLP